MKKSRALKYYEDNKDEINEFRKKKYRADELFRKMQSEKQKQYRIQFPVKCYYQQFKHHINKIGVEEFIRKAEFQKQMAELRLKYAEEYKKGEDSVSH